MHTSNYSRAILVCCALLLLAVVSCSHLTGRSSVEMQPATAASAGQTAVEKAGTPPQENNGKASTEATQGSVPPDSVAEDQGGSGEEPTPEKKVQSLFDEALDYVQVAQDFWQKGELDNALEALDQAYSLILRAETYDDPGLIQQKEDLRFMISKRILEIYASRTMVVNGHHDEIPRQINRHVQMEIERFTTGPEHDFFIQAYQRSGRYRPYIVNELKKAGLPVELSWLPLIESGYKVTAMSKARALGMWQFIPSTGYKFGLKRDTYVDERLDPEKSTAAAISYLKDLHDLFGDWTTVLAAYNCGEGRVLKVIRDQNINYLDNFWDLYERLPQETARYVPRFLATLHIVGKPKKFGLDKIKLDPPIPYEKVTVARRILVKDAALKIGEDPDLLKDLNPELRYGLLPPEAYELKVPPGKDDALLSSLEEIPLSSPPQNAFVYHRVRRGEALSMIAQRYGVSVRSICVANNIQQKNIIRQGQKLKIPQKGVSIYPVADSGPSRPTTTHIVKSGDSLWILAKRYNTTVNEIQEANLLSGLRLHVGQALKIPGIEPPPTSGEERQTYRVQSGDSPYAIAQRYRMTLQRFLQINSLTPRSTIYPGQILYVE